VRVANLKSGRSEPLVGGFEALDYDISADGRQVVMETADREGTPRLWLAPVDRSSPPQQIRDVEGGQPRFGPGGEIFFRRTGRRLPGGRDGRKHRVCLPRSPGRNRSAEGARNKRLPFCGRSRWTAGGSRHGLRFQTTDHLWSGFPLDGKPPVPIGWIAFG
jgi:hypothetical protein